MAPLSVVIIALNEEHNIVDCVRSAKTISDEVIVVDSGSNDKTVTLAAEAGARVINTIWKSYGISRNVGADAASNDWIFSLDADERISTELKLSIDAVRPLPDHIYGMRRLNYCEGRLLRFGMFGLRKVFRLYNRKICRWDDSPVHEKVVGPAVRTELAGHMHHYTVTSRTQYEAKLEKYAMLSADKFFSSGRKASWVKLHLSPVYAFLRGYIVRGGFLDGGDGYWLAKVHARFTRKKYKILKEMRRAEASPAPTVLS